VSYRRTANGERGLQVEPLPLSAVPGRFPGFPGGLPGPISRAPGPVGPTMPSSIFPTHASVGDVVTITGPFGTSVQGQVRVRFHGTSWRSPQIIGPGTASIVVPEGAKNGLCEVEIDGRRVFGTNCIILGRDVVGRPSHKGREVRAWSHEPHPVGDCLDMAPFGYARDARGRRVLRNAYGHPVPYETDPATIDIYGRPLTPSSTAPPLAIGPRRAPLAGVGDLGEFALFGSIGLMAYGWFTGNPTLRNVGVVSTLGLFLVRRGG
jgi:hypothetical protein